MKRLVFLIAACGIVFGQLPPAEFTELKITYRLEAGPSLIENRSGEIQINASPLLEGVRRLVVPKLNAKGAIQLRDLTLRKGGAETSLATVPVRQFGSMFIWEVPAAAAGDTIRFSVEQPVDLSGSDGAWWYSDSAAIPLAVSKGALRLEVPAGFAGSVDVVDRKRYVATQSAHTWTLDGSAAVASGDRFAISSFKTWSDFAKWLARRCPAEPGEGIRQLAQSVSTQSSKNGDRPALAAAALSERIQVHSPDDSPSYMCRPVEQIFREGSATPLEAQALLSALFTALNLPAERMLSAASSTIDRSVNPAVPIRALVKVEVDGKTAWYEPARLINADGHLSGSGSKEAALSLSSGNWVRPPLEKNTAPGSVIARLDLSITSKGTLQGAFHLHVTGPMRAAYAEGLLSLHGRPAPQQIFGAFLRDRTLRSTPVIQETSDALDVSIQIGENDFLPVIQRLLPLKLEVLPLATEPLTLPDGKLWLGDRGIVREEIAFELPPSLSLQSTAHMDDDRGYAKYSSGTLSEGRKFILFRELEIKESIFAGESRASLDAFWKTIRADQQRTVPLRRVQRVDLSEWIRSVSPNDANHHGLAAQQQREYDAARQLFEKAVKANPKDLYAWNNLGRALMALGRLDEARKAYERQIEINPRDRYAYNNLGLLYEREDQWEKAVELLKKQLEIDPKDTYATANLPRALINTGRWEEVEAASRKAGELQPTNVLHKVNIAIARVCLGKSEDARRELDASLGPRPSPTPLNNIGYYLTRCGKELDLAEMYIGRAIELTDGVQNATLRSRIASAMSYQAARSSFWDSAGVLALKKGQTARAVEYFLAAATIAPRAGAFANLAQAEWDLGRKTEALTHWREATFLQPSRLPRLPDEVRPQLEKISPLSEPGGWYCLPNTAAETAWTAAVDDRPSYFYVSAGPAGKVLSVRALDADDAAAKALSESIHQVAFPAIIVDSVQIPAVHLVRVLKRGSDHKTSVCRSVGPEVMAIAAELAPGDFPLPEPAPAPATPRQ